MDGRNVAGFAFDAHGFAGEEQGFCHRRAPATDSTHLAINLTPVMMSRSASSRLSAISPRCLIPASEPISPPAIAAIAHIVIWWGTSAVCDQQPAIAAIEFTRMKAAETPANSRVSVWPFQSKIGARMTPPPIPGQTGE